MSSAASPTAPARGAPAWPAPGSLGDPLRTPAGTRRLVRRVRGRWVAGVAGGLADHLGVDVRLVRAALALLTLAGGAGALFYVGLLATTPVDPRDEADREATTRLLALAALGAGLLLLLRTAGVGVWDGVVWPLLLGALGVALVWRQADDDRRARWREQAGRLPARAAGGPRGAVRVAAGVGLVALGGALFLAARDELSAARDGIAATLVVVAGLALVTAPYLLRTLTDLSFERRERIRNQERAELAAHLHDSVLQTLALIQRQADDPRAVVRLARAQERELRGWLYRPPPVPGAERLGPALESAAAEVEEQYAVHVEVVVVGGDRDLDDRLRALVQATREALVNAARASGAPTVSLYAEAEPGQVEVYVRDRGVGFDPDAVPEGRYGIAHSIVGRMARHGGTAVVRSAPGEGTEVHLTLPLDRTPA